MSLDDVLEAQFPSPDFEARAEAAARQARLTKPAGSLGRLESLVLDLAAWQGRALPESRPVVALLFAADHPVAARGVSAYPPEVTAAMVTNFLSGGAAASVLARTLNIPLTVVDVGVATPYVAPADSWAQLVRGLSAAEVGDLVESDGMSPRALNDAVRAGQAAVEELDNETRFVILGEMGIANTTVASALVACLAGGAPEEWVGPGTGVQGAALSAKQQVVRAAVERVGAVEPAEALRRLGGRELAALVGAATAAAARRMTVVVDGFIVSAAMLAAVALRPAVRPALVFAHRSAEPPHAALLERLGAEPLLDLGLRLGEASGALTAWPLIDLACRLHAGMATFDEAAVPTANDARRAPESGDGG